MQNILLLQLSGLAVLSLDDPIMEADRTIPKSDIEAEGVDALGLYIAHASAKTGPFSPYIVIDKIKCANTANGLAVNPADIEIIVRIHELSHYVSHLGKGILSGKIWNNFHNSDPAKKEKVAQGLTYLWILKFGSEGLLEAFQKLSDNCPDPYRQWQNDLQSKKPHYRNEPKNFAEAWADMAKDLYDSSNRIDFRWFCAGLSVNDVCTAENI